MHLQNASYQASHINFVSVKIYFSSDQSVENAGVAFVKAANERNEFFEKMNRQ